MKKLAGLIMCGIMIWCSCPGAAGLPAVETGKQLFSSAKLGTSGKSCATCHQNASKLKVVAAADEEELAEIINQCIAGPLKGRKLAPGSAEMKAMVLYLKSLTAPGK